MIGVTGPALVDGDNSAVLRRAMIDGQLRVSGVNDPLLLAAMDALPREAFVPAERRAAAYADRGQPLGRGRTLAPPLTHGQMLQEARPDPADHALLIGGGTGYLAALLAPLVGSLEVVESDPELAAAAPRQAGRWTIGPLTAGAPQAAPYSLIVIDGAIEQLPETLADQLVEGGRLVTGLVERGVTRLAVGRKAAGTVGLLAVGDADVPLLDDFAVPRRWTF
jgi:protein-L-isoaspartate(D-aspartate) O-methyltransferase